MQSSIRNTQPPSKRGMGQIQSVGGQRSNNMGSSSTTSGSSSTSSNMPYQGPLVLTPVSQLGSNPRRGSRASRSDVISEKGAAYDPEHYNPDGSLRTMHKLPGFDQSYAQAMKARYIRHSETLDREKELSVKDIFANKK